jgi:UDP-glucose:(heptosyl)LPS alpha-1,3-glucosyltransferase
MSEEQSTPRKVGLVIFRLAPAGGLEQHCLRLGSMLAAQGCEVTVLTTRPAPTPPGLTVETLAARGRTNHGRLAAFAEDAARAAAARFDVTVAFQAIPGFDVIFCADPSRARPAAAKRWLPRYATYARLEREAFAPDRLRLALLLARPQLEGFVANAGARRDRLVLLAPTVDRGRSAQPTDEDRAAARQRLGLPADALVWLWIGLQPKTKGLDRALRALAAVPEARLLVCGLDPAGRGHAEMTRLAGRLGVAARVVPLGFLDSAGIAAAMAAADLLVHPSRADVTGGVILEAMANGLPVITTAVCGFGEHVIAADAGVVLPEPFRAGDFAAALRDAPARLKAWSANARAYAARDDLYRGLERAVELILAVADDP